jgi:hypothetical protein
MNLKEALFSSTEVLKTKSRKQIRAWLWPLRALEIIAGPILSLLLLIQTYMTEVESEYKVGFAAYLVGAVLIFALYSRFTKWLRDWQTNKRIKYFLLIAVKILPLAAISIAAVVMQSNVEVFISVIEKIILAYAGSYIFNFFAEPLAAELMVRDKIQLNTENGRILD